MAAVAGAAIGAEALEPFLEKLMEGANTEIVGVHKTYYHYDTKGRPKESTTVNVSLKAWELAALVGAGVAWEMAIMLSDAFHGSNLVLSLIHI